MAQLPWRGRVTTLVLPAAVGPMSLKVNVGVV